LHYSFPNQNPENMKTFKTITIITIILAALVFGYFKCIDNQKEKIKQLEDKIALLKEEHIPIRFKISEKTLDSIKLVVKFYNADDEEINKLETKLPGQELSFDFYIVPVKDKFVAFPSKLFSNVIAASDGISVYEFYNNDGFPQIFESKNMDLDLKTGLQNLFGQIKAGQIDSINHHFGNMVHDIKDLRAFMPNMVYTIVCHTKGGIEIKEE
jgi:hypothetical protein